MEEQEGNGILEVNVSISCWEKGAGGRLARSVSVPLRREIML